MSDQATAVNETPAGVVTDIDIDKPTPVTQAPPTDNPFLKSAPEGYADKQWVQDLAKSENPMAELFKKVENQNQLIGKKSEGLKVPGEGATPEDWQAFHKAIGVPENVDGYAYEAPQVPDNLKEFFQVDNDLMAAMKAAALKGGVTPQAFKEMAAAFDGYYLGQLQTAQANAQAAQEKIQAEFASKYGERSSEVLANWGKLSAMAPEWTKPVFDALPDIAKTAIAAWADTVSGKYIKEDKLDFGNPTTQAGIMSEAEYADKYGELFAKIRSNAPGSPEHEKANAEMKALRAQAEVVFKR